MMELAKDSDIENLSKSFDKLDLINLKVGMEIDETSDSESHGMEIVQTSRPISQRFGPVHTRSPMQVGNMAQGAAAFNASGLETNTPFDKLRPEGINPFGIYLDLDSDIDISTTIDRWETSIRLAISVNRMNNTDAKRYIEISMVKSAQSFWSNQNPVTKATALEGEDLAQVVSRVAHLLRLEFVGEGYIDRDSPKYAEKYVQALLRLELNDICLIKDYIKIFKEYYYNIYGKIANEKMYLNLFYSKIPEPWSSNLIKEYPEPEVDTLGKRINFLREKLSDWCHQAYLMRKTKMIRRQNTLCCKGNDLITVIGEYKEKRSKRRKFSRSYQPRKRYFSKRRFFRKRKPRFFKKKPWIKKPVYKKNIRKKIKECRCYLCNEIGHYANECPKRFNNKIIELGDEELETMIQYEDLVRIDKIEELEDLDSDESILEEYTDSESEEESE